MRSLVFGIAAAAALACAEPLSAETPPPFPEFSAKRVGPPKPGAGRFITVQIDPTRTPEAAAPAAAAPEEAAQLGAFAWFWDEVAPDRDADPAVRHLAAMAALERVAGGMRDVPAPRLQDLRRLTEAYGVDILTASLDTEVSPALALAVMAVESSGRADAVSSAGAKGLMQLMPATAERFGVRDTTTRENIRGGIEYLDWLLRHFEGDTVLALAGYNAGEGAVRDNGGVPPFAETRDYVPKVLAAWRVARLLCMTPPELIGDGCVFQGQLTSASRR